MKQIKILLLILFASAYTSLIWANVMFDWIKIGANDAPIGLIVFLAATFCIIVGCFAYLADNWSEK